MKLQDALEGRRSIRKYQDRMVLDKDIQAIIEAAILAPSWKNSQVTRYHIVKSKEMVDKIKQALPDFNIENIKNVPVLIIPTIVLNRSGYERDGTPANELKNGWGYYDCGLQNMNMLLKAYELGLSTLVMGIRDAASLRALLDIDDSESIVSIIALGYGDIEPSKPKRKSVADITKYY